MRDRMERLLVLPLSFRCTSHSSVELGSPKIPKADTKGSHDKQEKRGHQKPKRKTSKASSGFLALPKPNIASGIQPLIRGIKSLTQLFFYKEEFEGMQQEMEIGYPTDVMHLTHIGLEGSTATNNVLDWDSLNPPKLLSLSSISFQQFELAMTAQAHQPNPSPRFG